MEQNLETSIPNNVVELSSIFEKALPSLEELIHQQLGFKPQLFVKVTHVNNEKSIKIKITSEDIINELGNSLVKTLFTECQISFWGGLIDDFNADTIWFNPKIWYNHPRGGSNGTDFIWTDLWFNFKTNTWKEGLNIIDEAKKQKLNDEIFC